MKVSTIILAMAAAVMASTDASITGPKIPESFSPCARKCTIDMYRVANTKLGCANPLLPSCLCTKKDFLYGLRDCAKQACKPKDSSDILSWATGLCQKKPKSAAPKVAGAVPVPVPAPAPAVVAAAPAPVVAVPVPAAVSQAASPASPAASASPSSAAAASKPAA